MAYLVNSEFVEKFILCMMLERWLPMVCLLKATFCAISDFFNPDAIIKKI